MRMITDCAGIVVISHITGLKQKRQEKNRKSVHMEMYELFFSACGVECNSTVNQALS